MPRSLPYDDLPSHPLPPPPPADTLPDGAEREALLAHLRSLPFDRFVRLVARLLERTGYREVRPMGATHGRGRNAYGGMDLRAVANTGLTRSLVIAQAKQYAADSPVPRTFVDELRGTMLRMGAQQGLLLTTSSFAPSALEAAQAGQHALPVRLVDGQELASLLLPGMVAYPVPDGAGGEEADPPAAGIPAADGRADRRERHDPSGKQRAASLDCFATGSPSDDGCRPEMTLTVTIGPSSRREHDGRHSGRP